MTLSSTHQPRTVAGLIPGTADDPFPFLSSWGLGDEAYAAILGDLRQTGVACLLEFGSGASTLRFARDLPTTSIMSVESDWEYYEAQRATIARHYPAGRVDLVYRPLAWQIHAGAPYLSYRPGPLPSAVGAILVDGPPHWTRRGREACLHQAFSALRVGGRVYLDDCVRREETTILRNWLRAYRTCLSLVRVMPVGHHVAVLVKTAHGVPEARMQTIADATGAALRIARRAPMRAIRALRPMR